MSRLASATALVVLLASAGPAAASASDDRAALAVTTLTSAAPGRTSGAPGAPGASHEAIVEGRLVAPCCYTQTLDVHESPMASELRLEIRDRLAAGDAPDAIEDDFVARYGERVRAVPRGRDPRRSLTVALAVALVASAVGLGALVGRWRKAARTTPERPPAARDAMDERIDAELRELEG